MPVEEPELNAPAEVTEEDAVLEDLPVLTVRDTVMYSVLATEWPDVKRRWNLSVQRISVSCAA